MMPKKILILNGPNLNMLGAREHGHYGDLSLGVISEKCIKLNKDLGAKFNLEFFQSNIEGELVDKIQQAAQDVVHYHAIIINGGAYTHTSVAILDALKVLKNIESTFPIIEVHLSNIHQREEFRQKSYISLVADGSVCGFKEKSYLMALWEIYHR